MILQHFKIKYLDKNFLQNHHWDPLPMVRSCQSVFNCILRKGIFRVIKHIIRFLLLTCVERKHQREAQFLRRLFEDLLANPFTSKRVEYILTIDENDPRLVNVLTRDERALPGNRDFLKSGWYRSMLTRYALAMYYAKDKYVLDTCSGLGWGAYLLDAVAKRVICIDIDIDAIYAAKTIWPCEKCIFLQGDALKLPFHDNSFDIVTAMESLEHFRLEEAEIYLREMFRVLKPGGRLIGSTPLPENEEGIKQELNMNPYHLHIFTPSELAEFLNKYFRKIHIFHNNRFFEAIK